VLQGSGHLLKCTIDITVWESIPTNTASGLLYYVHNPSIP